MIGRILAVAAAATLAAAPTAHADTATMSGLGGFRPDYASVGLCPCTNLPHPVMPWSVPAIADRIERWAATETEPRRLATYSLSTVAVLEYLERPDAKPLQVWAFGSPLTPRKGRDRKDVMPAGTSLTHVVALYDPIADPMARWNLVAAINSRLSTHQTAYDDLDLDQPDAVYEADGVTTKYFAPETLPMLEWRKGFTSPERMAELDAKYRPIVERAYDRPVAVPVRDDEEEPSSETPRVKSDDTEPTPSPTTSRSTTSAATTRTETTADEPGTSGTSEPGDDTKPPRRKHTREADSGAADSPADH